MASSAATKEELLSLIKQQEDQIKDLQDQIAQRDAAINAGDEGWIISTPNPNYTGRTLGVRFENGHAFLPARLPGAERTLGLLIKDFGYSATKTDHGQEIAPAPVQDKRSIGEKLLRPHEMTGGK